MVAKVELSAQQPRGRRMPAPDDDEFDERGDEGSGRSPPERSRVGNTDRDQRRGDGDDAHMGEHVGGEGAAPRVEQRSGPDQREQ